MKKTTKRILSVLVALVLFVSAFPVVKASAATVADVGSLWDGYTAGSGTFTVKESSRVYVVASSETTGDLLQTAQLIQRQLRKEFEGCFGELVWGDAGWAVAGDIVLKLDSSSGTGADGYKLDVTGTTAMVTAADTDGLIYGTNNLMKCFRAVGGNSISGFTGNDSPDTKERTVHLDLARKYYTVEWVKNFIRQMSWMGYNALELHLSEDGGFRADFWDPAYYQGSYYPENDFSWLCGSHVQSWVKDPYRNDPNAGDYLTTAELVDICNVAKEYHIEIIPSFDSPAHMDYITWKFEQNYKSNKNYSFTYNGTTYKASATNGCINYTGKTGASSPTWPYYTTIDITNGTMAKAFVFALYEDMADFFRVYAGSTNFNIGADEVNLSSSYGPKWSYSQFPGYVNELNRMLNAKGYKVRMYNDFIGSTTYNQKNSKAVYSFDSNIEICYWTSDFNPNTGDWSEPIWHVKFFWETNTGTSDNWGDGGRTMYNCIQTNTYYVLREGTSGSHRDARDPNNRNWTFYQTNEQDIYNNWYPADISEKGDYTEYAADVPAAQLGGAYFLIWNDYAALNTESEVWNGAPDCYTSGQTYYIFDIMASNIIKMWNSDINSTVIYDKFAAVREAVTEWFPGFTSCSDYKALDAAASLTKAEEPFVAADKEALQSALSNVITDKGNYTDESWNAYQAAVDAAKAVNANDKATQTEVDTALANLQNAAKALVEKVVVDKSGLQAALSNVITEKGNYTDESWNAYQAAVAEASRVNADDNATQADVDAALAALNTAKDALVENIVTDKDDLKAALDTVIEEQGNYTDTSWANYQAAIEAAKAVYNNEAATADEISTAISNLNVAENALEEEIVVNKSALQTAVDSAVTEQGDYKDDSWDAYTTALTNAQNVLANAEATQAEVDAALKALNDATVGLKTPNGPEILSIRKVSKNATKGKKIGLVINTTVNTSKVTVTLKGDPVTLTLCKNDIQTISGEQCRVWMINFPATECGNFNYVITADDGESEIVTITVK